jgi:hypothetical protein
MRDLLLTTLLLLPNIGLAIKSTYGSNAGYFVFCAWVAGAIIYGIFGLWLFIYGLIILTLVALIFRDGLKLNQWSSNSTPKR